jgi:hypothetical protein
MKALDVTGECRMPCQRRTAEGDAGMPPHALARRLKLIIRRRLSPQAERWLKMRSNGRGELALSDQGKTGASDVPTGRLLDGLICQGTADFDCYDLARCDVLARGMAGKDRPASGLNADWRDVPWRKV